MGVENQTHGHQQEQYALLTKEPSLHPHLTILLFFHVIQSSADKNIVKVQINKLIFHIVFDYYNRNHKGMFVPIFV